jgi:hypothetical protein
MAVERLWCLERGIDCMTALLGIFFPGQRSDIFIKILLLHTAVSSIVITLVFGLFLSYT